MGEGTRSVDIDEAECGCCWFVVGAHYAYLACPAHGGKSDVVPMSDDWEADGG